MNPRIGISNEHLKRLHPVDYGKSKLIGTKGVTISSESLPRISIEAWVAEQDGFRVVGVSYSKPFPFIERICNEQFPEHYGEHV